MDFSDIFSDLFGFGGFSDGSIFGNTFNNRNHYRRNGMQNGTSIKASKTITFDEAINGCTKNITVNYKDTCKTCNGTCAKPGTNPVTCTKCGGKGQVVMQQRTAFGIMQSVQQCPDYNGSGKIIKEKCTNCNGGGYISTKKTFEIKIPAGIDNGQNVKLTGAGEPGINGGIRGDLIVQIIVGQHPILKRQGINIYSTVAIDFPPAVLGGEIKVKTCDGDVMLTIKPGTQSDTKMRLKSKGVPLLRNPQQRGDQYITIVVSVPTNLNQKQKEALINYKLQFN